MNQPTANFNPTTPTDVTELITDLDAGMFERALSAALSQSAAATVDHQKVSEVTIKLTLKPIGGTHQVHMKHQLSFKKPTSNGKTSEESSQITTLHVGKYGRLTLTPESQVPMFDRAGQPTTAG